MEASRRPTARQRALLADLEALFLAEGFAAFTLDDIAGRLRCSKSTLYALAPSKEQLAVKVVAQFFRGAAERIEERIAGIDDAPKLIGEYLAGVAEHLNRASATFMRDIAEFAPARETYQVNSRFAAQRIRAFIDKGVADGVFRDVHARLVAEMTGLIVEGIQTGVLAQRTEVSDAEAFTALGELLLGGLNK
ncbi:TetR/AcrR family transcriptional regulator [Amycolatopsis sp., V23-08]|uniref:TetR/AcrR family transcriptional regulator n=1 Tax=Amycolatopsis heterodermiae TaxID=3110235 RepID=A0ABU5QZ80_9PSEU|nr:TetR/AcrR family transcriptional regulator [Amycolatopsis sp., V23-08]MEA5358904.1 TetR/AcrR family transcriptional regulator [Amycolatopsis sp., V23-08]